MAIEPPAADREPGPGMPRWVRLSLVVVAAIVAVFVILELAGPGGEHGPSRHEPAGGASVVDTPGGHAPPVEHGGSE